VSYYRFSADEEAAKLSPPPDVATLRHLLRPATDCVLVEGDAIVWHIYKRAGRYPARWDEFCQYGPVDARFDHHLSPAHVQTRGILYVAYDIATCIAEVYQRTRVIERRRDEPWLVAYAPERTLTVLDLTSSWPTRAGASMLVNDGPRAFTRAWSQAIYSAYATIDGLLYASSMYRHRPCIALYERAVNSVPLHPISNRALDDVTLLPILATVADEIGYSIAAP
jgi:hypothetical protein